MEEKENAQRPASEDKRTRLLWIVLAVLLLVNLVLLVLVLTKDKDEEGKSKMPQAMEGTTKAPTSAVGDEGGNGGEEAPTGRPENDGTIHTGNLIETGRGYEGTPGTGKYNYGEALQKAILFYELQRSGDLPTETRCNWRGDSGMEDGADNGVDLTGGLYDAGDNVKFNLPMAYTSAMLAWTVYESKDALVASGQYAYLLDSIRWVNDYLMKCHTKEREFYYQVGDGNADHAWWGPCEVMQMKRPSYRVTEEQPGSCVVAEAAASLAACSYIFREEDPAYAAECLKHAKSLYAFAEETKSDAGYTAANGFYTSWSGFYDELVWAGVWLYIATGDETYLQKAETYWPQADDNYKWTMCWDNVNTGATLLLARITEDTRYAEWLEKNLDYWTVGYNGERVNYTPKGLAYLDGWGALRYATTEAFIAALYSCWEGCDAKKAERYMEFAESQINYALGDAGQSFVVGFGENYPKHPHHRTAQGSYCDNMNEPANARHTLYGALVGGPNQNDYYPDSVADFATSEVACDYNAGFVGLLAIMYERYGGQTLVDFGAVEEVTEDELFVDASVNVKGQDFVEIRAFVKNQSGWPARVADATELRYFIDLSEVYEAGGSASDIVVSTNYTEGAKSATLVCWDEEKHIYYVSIDFTGTKIYPGGQSSYKKEVQFRIRNGAGVWNNENDPSFAKLTANNGSHMVRAYGMALYEDGEPVFGTIPPSGEHAGQTITPQKPENEQGGNQGGNQGQTSGPPVNTTAKSESVTVEWQNANAGNANTLALMLTITNTSDGTIDLGDLSVRYYFSKDSDAALVCDCDYSSAVSGESYVALSGVGGAFSKPKKSTADADTVCVITPGQSMELAVGGTWTLQVRIHRADWTEFNTANDYSAKSVEHIVICSGDKVIFGKEP